MRPLPSSPFADRYHYRWKDQIDFRYMIYVGVFIPLWRRLSWRWRHPWCYWPVKCDETYHRRTYKL